MAGLFGSNIYIGTKVSFPFRSKRYKGKVVKPMYVVRTKDNEVVVKRDSDGMMTRVKISDLRRLK